MFTVLMSVYAHECPEALQMALQSLEGQTNMPAEIVLVRDGPLTAELDSVIRDFATRLPLIQHTLEQNMGLASALNEGLSVATQPWIMRFDSDDVCLPNRVEMQAEMALNNDIDLFGAQIEEFDQDPATPLRIRSVPCMHDDILDFGKRRNPFNHMTVCYRREKVVAVGGYPAIPLMEDYALWMLLLSVGVNAANSPDVLVRARVGNGMVTRRGGIAYVISESKLQRYFVSLGLKSQAAAWRDGIIRSAGFLSPTIIRSWLYRHVLRN